MDNYIPFHLHTELSLLDSTTNFKLYVDKARQYAIKAICFTEHGHIYNWIEKKIYCDKNNIKYLHGCEVYLTEQLEPKVRDNYHTILIARNLLGFHELNTLVDKSTQEDHFYYKPRITFDEFINISDNIIKISACLVSPLNKLDKNSTYYSLLAKKYDFYEIQPHLYNEQILYNQYLYELSLKYNKPLIVGTDTHSIDKYKAECRNILQKAKGIEYADEDSFDLTFKSYDEVLTMLSEQDALLYDIYKQALYNTNLLYDMCENIQLDMSYKYPKLYDNDEEVFKKLIYKKYKEKLDKGIITKDKKYIENIQEEFRVFKKIGMCSFMLFFSELITWCRENDIPVGFCRGSVGGSTIAYITDIIDVNPITWNTVFSRFANEDRVEIGDIDCDFCPSDRDRVYNYIINRFGVDYTAYILAITTISVRGTIDEIGRALDIPLDTVETIKDEYDANQNATREKYPDLFYYFDGLLNTTISQSMHPAGIVASPITLFDNYGTLWNNGKRICQINMEEIHEVNLVKYDILGLKNIGIIKDTYKLLNSHYLLSHEINWNDKRVWNDIVTSPVGIFQFEGDYAFNLLKRYKPIKINDLSLINASLRPSGASYRDRLIAREFNNNPSLQIDELLKDNNGFLVFQEDTIKFLKDICGLSGSEADNIRRAIGRKQRDRLEKALPMILEGYCRVSPKPREIAEQEAKLFLKVIEDSSDYQFGYNHSTGYSMIGYVCAYLRYYYPLEFITSYLNNCQTEEDIRQGTELAKNKNIQIKPIQFRYSIAKYNCDKDINTIFKGIKSIKFMNEQIADELYNLGKKEYSNFIELLIDIEEETTVNTKQMSILIMLDFFKEFGRNKKLLKLFKEFTDGHNRYDKKHVEKTKEKRKSALITLEKEVPNEAFTPDEKIKVEVMFLGYAETTVTTVTTEYYMCIDIMAKYKNPVVTLYRLRDGKKEVLKIKREAYEENKFDLFAIIKPTSRREDFKWRKTERGFERSTEKEWYLTSWNIVK